MIRDLFLRDVTRDIPPVVYFHQQSPDVVHREVSEYIVTGGWPKDHPAHARVPSGIHEQYVRLLRGISSEISKPDGSHQPAAWISGFYGSGKSSFAKLLGLSLDGMVLPDGTLLADSWLRCDMSPLAPELRAAWAGLRGHVDPIAVIFDVGSVARDHEHIHAVAVRQVQARLGYCAKEPWVADYELRLERDGHWPRFEQAALDTLHVPWAEARGRDFAEDDFSQVLHALFPDKFTTPMAWVDSRAGTPLLAASPEDAVTQIRDMLAHRAPGKTLFLVVDEVSQYVVSHPDRIDRVRAFASALGARLRGKAWLLALGQQKIDEQSTDGTLDWAKDRFPVHLRVHLAASNIRDVVHRRLLQKRPDADAQLRALFLQHRPSLKLYAFGCEETTAEEFAEVYPLLPGHVDLLLEITSALRARSTRAQGDDQAIRGLLQLLGELFRTQGLADAPVGALVTLEQIYEVQHTALDSDVQASLARLFNEVTGLEAQVAKAVALLEQVSEHRPVTARLVAQCLYDRVDRGDRTQAVTDALEALKKRNLLGYTEKQGYKIQSSAGEEWERERRDIGVPREAIVERVTDTLRWLLERPQAPRLGSRSFPIGGVFSDGRRASDLSLKDPRDDASLRVDLRLLAQGERTDATWVTRSDEDALKNRLVWILGDSGTLEDVARDLSRSVAMVDKYKPRRDSLPSRRRDLLTEEESRTEELLTALRKETERALMDGRAYFRGRRFTPGDHGASFSGALEALGARVLPDLFPHFEATNIAPTELMQLLATDLSGPSPKFVTELQILELDAGRYQPTCKGIVPSRVLEQITQTGGLSGASLLAWFGGPPFGYTPNVVKACVAGLLRAGKVRIAPEGGAEINAVRDAGAREVFEGDRAFRRADVFPVAVPPVSLTDRARICKLFEERFGHPMDRENHLIADAVVRFFPPTAKRIRGVVGRIQRLPGSPPPTDSLDALERALERCLEKPRDTLHTVQQVKKQLEALRDGLVELASCDAELTEATVNAVRDAGDVATYHMAQLRAAGALDTDGAAAAQRIEEHLSGPRPWRDIAALDLDLSRVRAAYATERRRLLARQEEHAEQARSRVKARDGFAGLTADQSHTVLRPITLACTTTTAEAIAPALDALGDPFDARLLRGEDEANDLLDEMVVVGPGPEPPPPTPVVKVHLHLRNRELTTVAQVDALVGEIRERLVKQVEAGRRVRIV